MPSKYQRYINKITGFVTDKFWQGYHLDKTKGLWIRSAYHEGIYTYSVGAVTVDREYKNYYGDICRTGVKDFVLGKIQLVNVPHCCGSGVVAGATMSYLYNQSKPKQLIDCLDILFQLVESEAKTRFHLTQLSYYVVPRTQPNILEVLKKRKWKLTDRYKNANSSNTVEIYSKYPKSAIVDPPPEIKLMHPETEDTNNGD